MRYKVLIVKIYNTPSLFHRWTLWTLGVISWNEINIYLLLQLIALFAPIQRVKKLQLLKKVVKKTFICFTQAITCVMILKNRKSFIKKN